MKTIKKILCLILCLIMCFSFSFVAFAADESELQKDFVNPNSRILCVAKNGNTDSFPANSIEGIKSCIEMGVDVVTVNVRLTKDKQLVLLSEDDLSKVCAFKNDGTDAYGTVSKFNLEDIKSNFVLKAGNGGADASATGCTVTTLSEAIDVAKGKILIMVDNGYDYSKEINELAATKSACDTIILRGFESVDEIKNFVKESGKTTCYVAGCYIDGSSSGSAKDYIEKAVEAGAYIVELKSSKKNASVFKEDTLSKLNEKARAMVSTTDKSLCGDREDITTSWAELADQGFGMIETDYPKELVTYLRQIESYREDLATLIGNAEGIDTKNYTSASGKALETALNNAIEISSKGSVSFEKIEKARYDLKEALFDLTVSTGDEKTSLPAWLIIIIVVASIIVLIALIILGLRLFNRVKKGQRKLEKFKEKFNSEVPVENDESITTNIAEDEESNMGIEEETEETLEEPVEAIEDEEEIETSVDEEEYVDVSENEIEADDEPIGLDTEDPHNIATLLEKLEQEVKQEGIEVSLKDTMEEVLESNNLSKDEKDSKNEEIEE